MTLQNRIDPWGRLNAVPSRGTLLGNRGTLHNAQQAVVRTSQRIAWVTCVLQFNGRKRQVFGPNTYSELFFLDEATALAAGHRPCATCRRQRYEEFKSGWLAANGMHLPTGATSISDIDQTLHKERAGHGGAKCTFDAVLSSLPAGSFIDVNGEAHLVWQGGLRRWTFDGYLGSSARLSPTDSVRVLTPPSIVRLFAAGFRPDVHASVAA